MRVLGGVMHLQNGQCSLLELRVSLNLSTLMLQATAQNARLAVLNAVEDLDARRKLELLMTQQEQSVLLGNLATVPPDYKYVVQTAAPPAV